MSMKLEINAEEVEVILSEWAEHKFPGAFNTVKLECSSYSSFKSATFTKEKDKANATDE